LHEFTILDVGCALGDAAPVFKHYYPSATVSGCDLSETGIRRCVESYGTLARFFVSSIEKLEGFWDVIYCSNVMEHFENYAAMASILMSHCRILYIMTPYREISNGKPLVPVPGNYHKVTLYKNSFDVLITHGRATKVLTKTFECPGAWGWTPYRKFWHFAGSLRHGKGLAEALYFPRQITYEIFREG
jgi:SAM-dependent methyltransferase